MAKNKLTTLQQALANEQLDKMFIRIDGELISIKEVIKRIVNENT